MKLDSVRSLKLEMREALAKSNAFLEGVTNLLPFLRSGFPFAFGVRLTATEGNYHLAIRLPNRGMWFHLLRPALAKIVDPVSKRKELDLQVIGPARFTTAGVLPAANAALRIGGPVRHADGTGGTIGFFAKRGDRLGIVSCNHVLARIDKGVHGDRIIGPSAVELTLDGAYPRLTDATVQFKLADCAFAAFANGVVPPNPGGLDGNERLLATPVLPEIEMPVKKIGAKTNVRTGKVVVRELDSLSLEVGQELTALFDDVIEIESDNKQRRFSNAGDSGSLVYTTDLHPVGMLFADSAIGGTHKNGLSFANRFKHVTDQLPGVTLEV